MFFTTFVNVKQSDVLAAALLPMVNIHYSIFAEMERIGILFPFPHSLAARRYPSMASVKFNAFSLYVRSAKHLPKRRYAITLIPSQSESSFHVEAFNANMKEYVRESLPTYFEEHLLDWGVIRAKEPPLRDKLRERDNQ